MTTHKIVAQLLSRGRGRRVQGYASAYSQYPPGSSVVSAKQPPSLAETLVEMDNAFVC